MTSEKFGLFKILAAIWKFGANEKMLFISKTVTHRAISGKRMPHWRIIITTPLIPVNYLEFSLFRLAS